MINKVALFIFIYGFNVLVFSYFQKEYLEGEIPISNVDKFLILMVLIEAYYSYKFLYYINCGNFNLKGCGYYPDHRKYRYFN